jgi:hypothetical protein
MPGDSRNKMMSTLEIRSTLQTLIQLTRESLGTSNNGLRGLIFGLSLPSSGTNGSIRCWRSGVLRFVMKCASSSFTK